MQTLPLLDIGGIWHITYFVCLSLIGIIFTFGIGQALPLAAKLLWSYFLIWCLFIVEYPSVHFGTYTHSFQATAGQVLAEGILIPFAVITCSSFIEKAIPYFALFATACVWSKSPGLMHAPSFNMALAAMCIPITGFSYLSFFIVFTALTHHGSTALMIMGAQALGLVLKRKLDWRWLVIAACIMFISALILQSQPMFNSSERLAHWIEYTRFWSTDTRRIILGMGPGSFVWYSVMTHKYQTGFFLQMHNDYLEVLWALGCVGGSLAGLMIVDAVKRAWKKTDLVSLPGVLGCLAFMLTYEPIEYFPTALLTAFFFARALIVHDVDVEFTSFGWPIKSNNRKPRRVTPGNG